MLRKLKALSGALFATIAIATPTTSGLFAATAATGLIVASAGDAEAQTVRANTRQSARSVGRNTRQTARQVTRNPYTAGNSVARNARQTGRQVSRNTYQSARQINRRHFYALPAGYRWMTYGAYRYCFHGGLYYYPYMHGGRTVYIQVNVNSAGQPLPPPPSSQVIINVN